MLEVSNGGGSFSFSTCDPYTNYDSKLELFDYIGATGVYNDDAPCASNPNNPWTSTVNNISLVPGIYYLAVDGYNGATGNYKLSVVKN